LCLGLLEHTHPVGARAPPDFAKPPITARLPCLPRGYGKRKTVYTVSYHAYHRGSATWSRRFEKPWAHTLFPKPTSKRKLFVPCPVRKPRPSWRPTPPFVPPAYLISGDALSCPPGLLLLFFVLSPGACGRVLLLPVSDLLSRFDSSCVFYFSFFFSESSG
jgi:hypothetical protein